MSEERLKERCKREDIAIKVIKGFLDTDCDENTELYYSLNTLLDLYNKEKEKNKELENADLTTVYMNGFYDGEKKWKDKINEKIEEYNIVLSKNQTIYSLNKMEEIRFAIRNMQELLEERN